MKHPNTWHDAVQFCQQTGKSYVLVTVLSTSGSAPRSSGAKMVITDATTHDTIGGGHLEHLVTRNARSHLLAGSSQQIIENYPFDSGLGQCCGGAVHVLYEVITQHSQHLAIFGAGHVAKALVPILAQLPIQIHWIDTRSELFPATVPTSVNRIHSEEPTYELKTLPEHSWVLVMTHNHQLDFDIVLQTLKLNCFDFVGMIGSDTKARRFKKRLAQRGLVATQIQQLVSPVGDLSIPGKRPIEVAISIAAQLTRKLHEQIPLAEKSTQKALWDASKNALDLLK
ncbi:xanthine dehydrogenase accessory protein XdhC [Alteromonas sp. a30]|uniref:xanthine dehydrogenase accessory protein XdhC n=1 Tax=Alteromonas sp. a30 TaxID=2730917 RepID=UPI00228264B9|nr:xanthine dehydrogenase accessory protein XdhC [Alteromonas sp. a30]MCY7293887.1 xanthine dehydrogenase accessory protein XdhC [Alteromonas sp. a30]